MRKTKDKPFELQKMLERYFRMLINERGCSDCTIDTYAYTFRLLALFFKERHGLAWKDVTMDLFTKGNIIGFYDWIEGRGNSISTRNSRKAVISSFASYASQEYPEHMHEMLLIAGIKSKKTDKKLACYASVDGLNLILLQTDTSGIDGCRDHVMIQFLSVTGVRVSELVNIRICDIHFEQKPYALVHGKGGKDRNVYFVTEMATSLIRFLQFSGRYSASHAAEWLFTNHKGDQLTRFGVDYIVRKYVAMARKQDPALIPENFSTHKFRHSFAMGQIEAGSSIFEIKELLGHSSVVTTEIYARTASSKRKDEAIEKLSAKLLDAKEEPVWENDNETRNFLNSLKHGKNYV